LSQDIAISVNELSKSFTIKGEAAVDVFQDLSFNVNRGDFVSIVGPSGIGKSTLLYIMGTLDKADRGKVHYYIEDKTIEIQSLRDAEIHTFRNTHIGFIFQFHHLLPEFTAIENVILPQLIANKSRKEAEENAVILLERVGMSHRLKHKPSELSGGEQQRIAVARALVNQPSVILADEPTGNLDVNNSKAVLQLIRELQNEFGLTVVCATHSPEVAESSDKIIKMTGKGLET
jgi:lipoprotein-releasing system ATP-binding protein